MEVWAHVTNEWDLSILSRSSAALTVLNSDTLSRLNTNDFAGMEIDGGIGFGGGLLKRCRGTEDVVGREVLVLADLPNGCLNTAESAGADDGHTIFLLLVEGFKLLHHARAGLCVLFELFDDLTELAVDVRIELVLLHLEAEFVLERDQHAAEVLSYKVFEKLGSGVAFGLVVLFQNLIGKLGTGFEGERFGKDKSIVAIEEDLDDLGWSLLSLLSWPSRGSPPLTLGILISRIYWL